MKNYSACKELTLLWDSNSKTGALANSEDPDEMPHYMAFHLGLHFLLRQKRSLGKEIKYYLKIFTGDLSIYTCTINHPDLTVSNCIENFIGPKRVNQYQSMPIFT